MIDTTGKTLTQPPAKALDELGKTTAFTDEELEIYFRVSQALRPSTYTPDELAAYLRVSPRTVLVMLEEGELKAFKVRQQWRIELGAFVEWKAGGGSIGAARLSPRELEVAG